MTEAVAQPSRHYEHHYEREYGQEQGRSMVPERGYGGTAGGSGGGSGGVEVEASPVDEWPQMEEEEEEEYETDERSLRHGARRRPHTSAVQRDEGAMQHDHRSALTAPNWEHTALSSASSSAVSATGAGAAAGSASHSPSDRSARSSSSHRGSSRHDPQVFDASHPRINSEPPSELSFHDDGSFGEASDTVSLESCGSSRASSSRADAWPSGSERRRHRRMESAEVLEEFERTIQVRGLDYDEQTLELQLSDDAYLAAEVAARKSALQRQQRHGQSPSGRWDDLPSLHAASRPSSVISLATRSAAQPALLYLDKVQRDGTTVRLCIHQRDNSLHLAALYLRCLQLPTTDEYVHPLSKLIQRKIRAFVANVQREREDKAALLRSLQRKAKADVARGASPQEEAAPTPRAHARPTSSLKPHATVRFSPQLAPAHSASSASIPPAIALRRSHPHSSRPPPLTTAPRMRNGLSTSTASSAGWIRAASRSLSPSPSHSEHIELLTVSIAFSPHNLMLI